jgi:guanylate kinase
MKEGLFIVVSAPSGTGKSSLCKAVLGMCPELHFSVSFTTRPPRRGEVNGKDYFFISEEAFRERIRQGEFIEWVENFGYFYGTSEKTIKAILAEGYDLILDVESRGAKALKNKYPDGIFVFILPPSMSVLRSRLSGRGGESETEMETRLAKAGEEVGEVLWYDYVIFNDALEDAIDHLRAIYLAEKSRYRRLKVKIRALLNEWEALTSARRERPADGDVVR